MKNNELVIACAGAGKTTLVVDRATKIDTGRILITTYTEANEQEIKNKIIEKLGYIPKNITIQTWFTFLLQHGVRPYQSVLNEDLQWRNIGFYLSEKKSGIKLDKQGKPVKARWGGNAYWGESENFLKFYFTPALKMYSDKVSKFICTVNKETKGKVISRTSRIFDHIFVDEVQDLAGYDLEILKLLFKTTSTVTLVGDPRQVTYLTHYDDKYKKYRNGQIKKFIENELGKRIECVVDETTLSVSHRCNQAICDYSSKLYPEFSPASTCSCPTCRNSAPEHQGVFLVKPADVDKYLKSHAPNILQLRWNISKKINSNYEAKNIGESKGITRERVLIYPTEPMCDWIRDNKVSLKTKTRASFYVALTRARYSSAIVFEYDDHEQIEGLTKWVP